MTEAPISSAAQAALWTAFKTVAHDKRLSGTAALAAGLADAPEVVRAEFEGVAISIDTPTPKLPMPKAAAVCVADRTPEALAILKGWEPFVHVIDDQMRAGFILEAKTSEGRKIEAQIDILGARRVGWSVCDFGSINERGTSASVSKAYRAAMAALRTVVPEAAG